MHNSTFFIKTSTSVKKNQTVVMKMQDVETQKGRTIALVTMDTKEMDSVVLTSMNASENWIDVRQMHGV